MVDTASLMGREPSERATLEFDEQHAVEMWEMHSLYMFVYKNPEVKNCRNDWFEWNRV